MSQLAASYQVPSIVLMLNDGFSLCIEAAVETKRDCGLSVSTLMNILSHSTHTPMSKHIRV